MEYEERGCNDGSEDYKQGMKEAAGWCQCDRYLDPTETKMRPRAYAAVGTVVAAGGADGFVYSSQRKHRVKLGYNG